MELYYAIMNILDYYAKNHKRLDPYMKTFLNILAIKGDITIEDVADANDCGNCKTWAGIVRALSEQFKNGDRI